MICPQIFQRGWFRILFLAGIIVDCDCDGPDRSLIGISRCRCEEVEAGRHLC